MARQMTLWVIRVTSITLATLAECPLCLQKPTLSVRRNETTHCGGRAREGLAPHDFPVPIHAATRGGRQRGGELSPRLLFVTHAEEFEHVVVAVLLGEEAARIALQRLLGTQ